MNYVENRICHLHLDSRSALVGALICTSCAGGNVFWTNVETSELRVDATDETTPKSVEASSRSKQEPKCDGEPNRLPQSPRPSWCLPYNNYVELNLVRHVSDVQPNSFQEFEIDGGPSASCGFVSQLGGFQIYYRNDTEYRFVGLFDVVEHRVTEQEKEIVLRKGGDAAGDLVDYRDCTVDCTARLVEGNDGIVRLHIGDRLCSGRFTATPDQIRRAKLTAALHRAVMLSIVRRSGLDANGPCSLSVYDSPISWRGCFLMKQGCNGTSEVLVCSAEDLEAAWTLDGEPAPGNMVACGSTEVAWQDGTTITSEVDESLHYQVLFGLRTRLPLNHEWKRPDLPNYPEH